MWSKHKLAHDVYLAYAAEVRVGFVNREKQVEAVQRMEKRALLQRRQAEVALRLAPLRTQFHPMALNMILPWARQYVVDAMRYKFLVLRGVSRSGKSTIAEALGDAHLCGFGKPFVQTVQDAAAPDLRGFLDGDYGYVVFDNVNDQDFVMSQRALFQASNRLHTLGDSKTGIYSYPMWLYRIPIVVTVDTSAHWDPQEPWIRENCHDIFLAGPCYL